MVMNRPDQIPPATELFQNFGAAVIINIPSSKVRVPMVVIAIPMEKRKNYLTTVNYTCLLYTSPSPRDQRGSRMPSSA